MMDVCVIFSCCAPLQHGQLYQDDRPSSRDHGLVLVASRGKGRPFALKESELRERCLVKGSRKPHHSPFLLVAAGEGEVAFCTTLGCLVATSLSISSACLLCAGSPNPKIFRISASAFVYSTSLVLRFLGYSLRISPLADRALRPVLPRLTSRQGWEGLNLGENMKDDTFRGIHRFSLFFFSSPFPCHSCSLPPSPLSSQPSSTLPARRRNRCTSTTGRPDLPSWILRIHRRAEALEAPRPPEAATSVSWSPLLLKALAPLQERPQRTNCGGALFFACPALSLFCSFFI